jgi:hypothetical protein
MDSRQDLIYDCNANSANCDIIYRCRAGVG